MKYKLLVKTTQSMREVVVDTFASKEGALARLNGIIDGKGVFISLASNGTLEFIPFHEILSMMVVPE